MCSIRQVFFVFVSIFLKCYVRLKRCLCSCLAMDVVGIVLTDFNLHSFSHRQRPMRRIYFHENVCFYFQGSIVKIINKNGKTHVWELVTAGFKTSQNELL